MKISADFEYDIRDQDWKFFVSCGKKQIQTFFDNYYFEYPYANDVFIRFVELFEALDKEINSKKVS